MAAKHWIAKMHLKKGAFTAKANAHGKSVAGYAAEVLAPGSHASSTTKRQANLARTFSHMHHGGK